MRFDSNTEAGLVGDHREPATWRTPFDELAEAEEEGREEAEDLKALLSHDPNVLEALRRFLLYCVPVSPTGRITPSMIQTGMRRLVVVASYVLPQVGEKTFTELAAAFGCTRATLSQIHVTISDQCGGARVSEKTSKARRAYSDRAKRVWNERKSASQPEAEVL